MDGDVDLKDTLLDLVVQYGLQALARVMGTIGSVTSGIVSEVAGVEGWLATQPPPAA